MRIVYMLSLLQMADVFKKEIVCLSRTRTVFPDFSQKNSLIGTILFWTGWPSLWNTVFSLKVPKWASPSFLSCNSLLDSSDHRTHCFLPPGT